MERFIDIYIYYCSQKTAKWRNERMIGEFSVVPFQGHRQKNIMTEAIAMVKLFFRAF